MCAGKRRTLRATIVTLFSHIMTRVVSVFVKCDTIFRFFLEIIRNSNFYFSQGSAETYRMYGGKYYMAFDGNLVLFPAVTEFCKSVKNWKSYQHEFGVLLFWDTV